MNTRRPNQWAISLTPDVRANLLACTRAYTLMPAQLGREVSGGLLPAALLMMMVVMVVVMVVRKWPWVWW